MYKLLKNNNSYIYYLSLIFNNIYKKLSINSFLNRLIHLRINKNIYIKLFKRIKSLVIYKYTNKY